MMTANAARGRADGRGILGVEGRRTAVKIKIGATFQEPDATVPAENAVVIADGAYFFRFGEAAHGLLDKRQKDVRGVADQELGLGAALVGVAQTLKNG